MDRQQQYRGKKERMPLLLEGELGYCTDEKELYIGGGEDNILVGSGKFAEAIKTLADDIDGLNTDVKGLSEDIETLGSDVSNVAEDLKSLTEDVNDKLTAQQAEAIAALTDTADIAQVIACLNSLLNNLTTAGIMKSST